MIAYVGPSGGRAASAGFMILVSADVAAMAPGTNTGAAHPVLMGGEMDEVMKAKVSNDAAASVRSVTGKRGRNPEVPRKPFSKASRSRNRKLSIRSSSSTSRRTCQVCSQTLMARW